LPTAANPTITAGGLCGESKLETMEQVRGPARALLARYTSMVAQPGDIETAEEAMAAASIDYPVVAKPAIGCNGTGVRVLRGRHDVARYLAEFPRGERIVLQEFVADEGEAGIFYVRHPHDTSGRITSITLKHAPVVVGDGRSTLRQLILADPRAGRVPRLYLPRLAHRLHDVPKQGERVRLVFVGNHCKGSIFADGAHLATPALTQAVERIARALPGFHFGRIDVRFTSQPALLRGEGFRIIEINGAGSEATHIWDRNTTLRDAWRAQFFHYGAAFRIAAANRARGHRSCGLRTMYRLWRRQKQLMAAYPMND
jgi:Carbamoyl-phosphate synthase L chain, ATP binding domain